MNDLISRAEAIDVVRSLQVTLGGKGIFHPEAKKSVIGTLDDLPTIDTVEVVRCKDCRYREILHYNPARMYCNALRTNFYFDPDFFCKCGAKMDAEVEG